MELDLVARWTLYFFGSCLVGVAVGFVVARLSTFELGLGVGLLIPGLVSLAFTVGFFREYRDLSFNPLRTTGRVIAVEDRAVDADGHVTTPVAVVEYQSSDGATRRADTRGATSFHVDDEVVVVPRLAAPMGVVIGTPREMQGGAIASMLFGTFPFSAGFFFLASALVRDISPKKRAKRARRQERSYATVAANLLMVAGILATPFFSDPVEHAIMLGFGVVSVGLWVHVVQGIRHGADARWTLGVGVVAINFTAWVVALWLLTDPIR